MDGDFPGNRDIRHYAFIGDACWRNDCTPYWLAAAKLEVGRLVFVCQFSTHAPRGGRWGGANAVLSR